VELDAIEDMDSRGRRLVELNVLEQSTNLYKTYAVQQRRVETYQNQNVYGFIQPRIHPTVYEPATGELRPLDVEMKTILKDLAPIYGLYRSELGEGGEESGEFEGMGPSYATP
jgi:carbonic anhydrase